MRNSMRALVLGGLALASAAVVRADEGGDEGRSGAGKGGSGKGGGDARSGAALYAANCASCHGPQGRGGRGPDVVGRSAGDIWEALREGEGGMPRFKSLKTRDARDLAAFLRDPGAVAFVPPPTPDPSPSLATPTWRGGIQAVFAQNCASCHAGAKAPAKIRLDSYAAVRANASRALSAIQAGRMPLGAPLPAATVQAVAAWLAGGTPK